MNAARDATPAGPRPRTGVATTAGPGARTAPATTAVPGARTAPSTATGPGPRAGRAPGTRAGEVWYRRLGQEVRNVVITMVATVVVLAAFVGAVIVVTALATR